MQEPSFTRGEVARILNVVPLTISNREKQKKYPTPRRDLNGYRIYSLADVLELQKITFSAIDVNTIISVLYDKGIKNAREASHMIDTAISQVNGSHA